MKNRSCSIVHACTSSFTILFLLFAPLGYVFTREREYFDGIALLDYIEYCDYGYSPGGMMGQMGQMVRMCLIALIASFVLHCFRNIFVKCIGSILDILSLVASCFLIKVACDEFDGTPVRFF
ncbi:hypothetical protein [uncultured Alistipes sp.]|uniref:hypothetical protein n=1 Tax=uncultured Alistipes sp. TaxID=538949 RepID=UPI002633548B|nr:hypothetical protein [uncultured Alistipes sp.]